MADLTTNTIPKATGTTQVDDSLATDDGATLKYGGNPVMPVISSMAAADSAALAIGSTTFVDTVVSISLPVGTYYVEGYSSASVSGAPSATSNGAAVKVAKTGTITETGTDSTDLSLDMTAAAWVPQTGADINISHVFDGVSDSRMRTRFVARVVVAVAGVLKFQVAQTTTGGDNAGVIFNRGSYLKATRVA